MLGTKDITSGENQNCGPAWWSEEQGKSTVHVQVHTKQMPALENSTRVTNIIPEGIAGGYI